MAKVKGGPPHLTHVPTVDGPTSQQREMVRAMSAYGINQTEIAYVMDLSIKTLQRVYRRELDTACAEATAKVAQALFHKAINGDTTAMIYWLACRGKWVKAEKVIIEEGENAKVSDMSAIEIRSKIAELDRHLQDTVEDDFTRH